MIESRDNLSVFKAVGEDVAVFAALLEAEDAESNKEVLDSLWAASESIEAFEGSIPGNTPETLVKQYNQVMESEAQDADIVVAFMRVLVDIYAKARSLDADEDAMVAISEAVSGVANALAIYTS